jgi:hypothetical protein
MNFLNLIIDQIPLGRRAYDAAKAQGKTDREAVEEVLYPLLRDRIAPLDANSMKLPLAEAVSKLEAELVKETDEQGGGLNALMKHAIHAVFAFIIGPDPGLGVDLTRFSTFEEFDANIKHQFVAKLIAVFLQSGPPSTLLYINFLFSFAYCFYLTDLLYRYQFYSLPFYYYFITMIGFNTTQGIVLKNNPDTPAGKKAAVAPDMGPLINYFNIPAGVNDPRNNRHGLLDIEW